MCNRCFSSAEAEKEISCGKACSACADSNDTTGDQTGIPLGIHARSIQCHFMTGKLIPVRPHNCGQTRYAALCESLSSDAQHRATLRTYCNELPRSHTFGNYNLQRVLSCRPSQAMHQVRTPQTSCSSSSPAKRRPKAPGPESGLQAPHPPGFAPGPACRTGRIPRPLQHHVKLCARVC